MKFKYSQILTLSLLSITILIKSCPHYPNPEIINQKDERLIQAYIQIDEMIKTNMKLNNITSFIATIVYMNEIVWSKSYGNINPLDDTSPLLTTNSIIRIGSITKLFTSLMMFKMRDNNLINSLDDEIKSYFPKFKINDINNMDCEKRGITFRELASHQSGLPRETPCEFETYGTKKCTENLILKRLSKQFLIFKQYKQTHYSNLGYSLLGRVLGEIADLAKGGEFGQESYEYYVYKEIFKPLGMVNSTFKYNELNLNNLALPYAINQSNGEKVIVNNQISGWNSPGGGIYSTAEDMCKFMMLWLNGGNESIIQESSLDEALSSVSLLTNGYQSFGLPFEMWYDEDTNMWFKGKDGLISGYKSQVSMAVPLKLGAFFVSMLDIKSQDLFTRSALKILIPIYETILNEMQIKKLNSTSHHHNSFNNLIVGKYNDTYGNEFSIFYDNHDSGILVGNSGDDSPNYLIDEFHIDYPHIKRLKLINYQNNTCSFGVNVDGELIYFKFYKDFINVEVMGQSLSKKYKNNNNKQIKIN